MAKWIKRVGAGVLLSWLCVTSASAQNATWVSISGNVQLDEGTPICAMVLANGQYMFSCDGTGAYDLTVPPDASGEINLFAFADGFAPYRVTSGPNIFPFKVQMQRAAPNSPLIDMTRGVECAPNGWVRIYGEIESFGGAPLCAMVLANGQHMFSCDDSLGRYDLTVPIDQNGQITAFGFADGFQPRSETFGVPDCSAGYAMLDLVNNARSQGRQCGDEGYFPPAKALSWSYLLVNAAVRHSSDMATHDFFSHTGSDGSWVSDRVTDTGYDWWMVGENVAAGYKTTAAAVQALSDSPGHCANIMDPNFEEFGAASSYNPSSYYVMYWTQVFGTSW